MARRRTASLAERIAAAPPLADPERARARLEELAARAERAPDAQALGPLLREGSFRDLLAALADHATFLWGLAAADPARLARLATHDPDAGQRALVAAQAGLFREVAAGRLTRDDLARALRRNRAEEALLVALADIGGAWSVEASTQALSD